MTVLSAQTIQKLRVIEPCNVRTVDSKGMTHGLSPCGYDVRVEFSDSDSLRPEDRFMYLGPGEFKLASTIEKFEMPNDVVGIVHDKSTWARRGLAVQNTVIEPGWHGFLTLELTNHSRHLLQIERGDPIAQIIFHRLDEPTRLPYGGKYQGQSRGPQAAR